MRGANRCPKASSSEAKDLADALPKWLDKGIDQLIINGPPKAPAGSHPLLANLLLVDGRKSCQGDERRWSALHISSGVPVIVLLPWQPLDNPPPGVSYLCVDQDKPVTPETAKKIAQACSPDPRRLVISGELLLGLDTKWLARGHDSFPLTTKECRLLQLFMSRPGQVLDRGTLMREVWDTHYTGDTRTIDVHICWLRKKIEEDPRHPILLRTVRGMGYRFETA